MIIDTNAPYTRIELAKAFRELRLSYFSIDDTYKYHIKKDKTPNNLQYYVNMKTLAKRICEIAGQDLTEVKEDKKGILRTIIWSIGHSYGHSESDLKKVFGNKDKSRGLSLYYRDKLRDLLLTHPYAYKIYDTVIKTLERDEEIVEYEFNN